MPLLQSNLRKQIRKLPKILQFVKIIHYCCELFTSLLSAHRVVPLAQVAGACRQQVADDDGFPQKDDPEERPTMFFLSSSLELERILFFLTLTFFLLSIFSNISF